MEISAVLLYYDIANMTNNNTGNTETYLLNYTQTIYN